MESQTPAPVTPVVRPLSSPKNAKLIFVGVGLAVILVGVGFGWVMSSKGSGPSTSPTSGVIKKSENEIGSKDEKSFPDTAEGELKDGGVKGEGAFHLDRPGGSSQTVALTSTVVDLSGFVGKKVQVWGATFACKKAPWCMDVGKIKVLE